MLLGASALGCMTTVGEDEGENLGTAEEAALTSNALTSNALTSNALTSNALTSNALTSNALTSNALTSNALTSNALTDANARELLRYVVSCALPKGAKIELTIDGTAYRFEGQLGLAPEWGLDGGSCDATCRGWVSGCVLSRLNYLGQAVPISVRGDSPALGTTPAERGAFPKREAAYFGDIFASPQINYACLSPGSTSLTRVCGPSLDGCPVHVVAMCNDACDAPSLQGAYPNCRDKPRVGGSFPADATLFPETVTVFLQH
jgi:hypothetical protein